MQSCKALKNIKFQDGSEFCILSEYDTTTNRLLIRLLNITDTVAYIGEADSCDLRTQATKVRLTFKEYLSKASEALFDRSTTNTYKFYLEKQDTSCTFKWKSVDSEETIINLGIILLKKINFINNFIGVMQTISDELEKLNSNMCELRNELEKSKKQSDYALLNFTKAVEVKDNLEKEMYAKFVLVLNEKKRRIRELNDNQITKVSSVVKVNGKQKMKRTKAHLISDSSDEYDVDGPSTSKNDSLLFMEEKQKYMPSTRGSKIRNRKTPYSKPDPVVDSGISKAMKTFSKIMSDSEGSDDLLLDCM